MKTTPENFSKTIENAKIAMDAGLKLFQKEEFHQCECVMMHVWKAMQFLAFCAADHATEKLKNERYSN